MVCSIKLQKLTASPAPVNAPPVDMIEDSATLVEQTEHPLRFVTAFQDIFSILTILIVLLAATSVPNAPYKITIALNVPEPIGNHHLTVYASKDS